MNKYKSLSFNIWLYFMAFIAAVFLLMWLFQIVFLKGFYRNSKINDINYIVNRIEEYYAEGEYAQEVSNLARYNEVCIVILDKYGRLRFPSGGCLLGGDCMLHSNRVNLGRYLDDITKSPNKEIGYTEHSSFTDAEILVYGCRMEDNFGEPTGYLFINSPLSPVESTVAIIENQMYIIFAVLIVIGLVLSLFASNTISKPLVKVTKSATRLAKGDYTVQFAETAYSEVQKLSETLTYAAGEISKVDQRQRDLIANVSHDLKTPLTMIKAYAEMIRDLSGDNRQKREQHLKIIIGETDRLALLVNDMLALSKLESGKDELNCTTFPIKEELLEIIERFKDFYSLYLPDSPPFTFSCENVQESGTQNSEERLVYADRVKIQQVIYNFISNAMIHTGDDRNIYIRQINESDGVRIEVTDTGKGIPKEDLKLIFQKYYRSANYKRETSGSGLGLFIAKSILEKHRFPYGVKSELGKGSTFWFKIKN
ncbi:MAG: HAMP domain-containing histidine kinase [Oscillospiraceae bacterium]|jgi:signal transduction histidine kinase|nr:HAMP domain-containing histidine kinase [Oscillospiraceae bacterium]